LEGNEGSLGVAKSKDNSEGEGVDEECEGWGWTVGIVRLRGFRRGEREE